MDDSEKVPPGKLSGEIDWNEFERPSRRRRAATSDSSHLRAVGEDEREATPQWLRDAGVGTGYDSNKFYLKSSDGRGHQYAMRGINVPQSFAFPINSVKDHFPEYRTMADVVRDALVHLMVMRMKQMEDGTLTEVMREEVYLSQIDYNKRLMETRKQAVDSTKESCELAVSVKDWARLDIILDTLEDRLTETFDEDHDSPYYKALSEILRQYQGEMARVREKGEWKDKG